MGGACLPLNLRRCATRKRSSGTFHAGAEITASGTDRKPKRTVVVNRPLYEERMYWSTKVSISEKGKKSPVSLP
jgi:hypothetical protein